MSVRIHVMCRSAGPLTRAALVSLIEEEIDFCDDFDPRFEPDGSSLEARAEQWDTLDIHYGDDQLIQLALADDDLVAGTVHETVSQHGVGTALASRLEATRMMLTIRLRPDAEIARGVWDMLACLETCVAKEHDGIVLAKEGIYDADLELLMRF